MSLSNKGVLPDLGAYAVLQVGLSMARYRGQMALYEAMQKTRLKPTGPVVPVEPGPKPEVQPAPEVVQATPEPVAAPESQDAGPVAVAEPVAEPEVTEQVPPSPPVRWQRPKRIQFNAGQLELTVPYPLAGAIILALVLIILAAYRWGQVSGVRVP